jgi:hypothetical protein
MMTFKRSVATALALFCTMGVAQAASIIASEDGDTAILSGSEFDRGTFTSTSAGESATGSGGFLANATATGSALVVLTEGVGGPASDWIELTYSGAGIRRTERITANWNSDSETGALPAIPVIPGVTTQFLAETGGSQDVTALLGTSAGGNFPSNITIRVQSDAVEAVPEPTTWAMLLIGFAGLGFVAYRKARPGTISIA